MSDSSELFASQEYVALIATQKRVAIKAFRGEDEALEWLLGQ